jgi:MFS family permease
VLILASMRFFAVSYWGAHMLLIPLLIYRATGHASAAAYYVTASYLFASICQLLAGRLLDRFGCRRPTIVMTAALGAISVLTAFFSRSITGLYICGVLGAGIAWALATATPSLITRIASPEEHGRALGVAQLFTSAGSLLGTQAGGWLIGVGGGLAFLLLGLANLAMTAAAVSLGRWLGDETSE